MYELVYQHGRTALCVRTSLVVEEMNENPDENEFDLYFVSPSLKLQFFFR